MPSKGGSRGGAVDPASLVSAGGRGGGQQKISSQERSYMITWLSKAENRNIISGAVGIVAALSRLTCSRKCWQREGRWENGGGQTCYDQGTGVSDDGALYQP